MLCDKKSRGAEETFASGCVGSAWMVKVTFLYVRKVVTSATSGSAGGTDGLLLVAWLGTRMRTR